MSRIALSDWNRLQTGAKIKSAISGHVYEIASRTLDPYQKQLDWQIPAFQTTDGKRITYSRLWFLVDNGESMSGAA